MNSGSIKTGQEDIVLDWDDCPCAGRTLDKLIQPAILATLAAGPLHGYRLTERIGQLPAFGGQEPDASGVYRCLKAMESKGLVASAWILSDAGPAKRSYQLTSAGERCLQKWIVTLEGYRDGITTLLKAARKAVAGKTPRSVPRKAGHASN
jgi:DNA-binding PadR family transcriptional regulator